MLLFYKISAKTIDNNIIADFDQKLAILCKKWIVAMIVKKLDKYIVHNFSPR
jgi:hypothetical protein